MVYNRMLFYCFRYLLVIFKVFSVVGVMLEVIVAMIIYTNVIEKKYKKIL